MKTTSVLFLAAVLCVAMLPASAQNYTGDYAWLRFWDGATVTASGIGWRGTWGGPGWSAGNVPGVAWVGSHQNLDPTTQVDQWCAITWTQAMTLTGARVEAITDQYGRRGHIEEYTLQYLLPGMDGSQNAHWVDIPVAAWGDSTHSPLTLTGINDYYVRFLDSVTTTSIRVFFPKDKYDHLPTSSQWDNEAARPGPGVAKFLPIGNLASGEGLDPSNSSFNIFATDWATGPEAFLNIAPKVHMINSAGEKGGAAAGWIDNTMRGDGANGSERFFVYPGEGVLIDLGTSLDVHGVTLYTPSMQAFNSAATMEVYVTDDPDKWGQANWVGTAKVDANGMFLLSGITEAVGQYVILTGLVNNSFILVSEIAVNATKIPEPATMALLAMGGLALLRRRR